MIGGPVKVAENPDNDKLVGNVHLKMLNDATICSAIGRDYYLPELGARSISRGVDQLITNPLVARYLESGEDFNDDQPASNFEVGINQQGEVEIWRSEDDPES